MVTPLCVTPLCAATINSTAMVVETNPKARIAASGKRICVRRLTSSSSGVRPAAVGMDVSRIGRKRARPACLVPGSQH